VPKIKYMAAAVALMSVTSFAQAAAPFGTLTFIDQSGTIGPTADVPVWMRLTVDPTSTPLVVDQTLERFGLDEAEVPAAWLTLDRVFINTYFGCSSTFTGTGNCVIGTPYRFDFNLTGPDTINGVDPIEVLPGASRDYLFGTFVPSQGAVPEGTYHFYSAGVTLNLLGREQREDENGMTIVDAFGNPVLFSVEVSFDIAASCSTGDLSCAFSRTVVGVVPEPQTYAMMLAGLGLVGVAAMRRRRKAAAR